MKNNLLHWLKKISISLLLGAIRFFSGVKNSTVRILSPSGKKLFSLTGAVVHPIILFLYSWYVKGAVSLQKRGSLIKHPLLALVSREHLHHAILISISVLTMSHATFLKQSGEQEFFVPKNNISHFIPQQDEFGIDAQDSAPVQQQAYLPQTAVRSQPGGAEGDEHTKQSPDPGSLAAIPEALIKPVLPTLQQQPYKASIVQTYVVGDNDTPGSIAQKFGISLMTLLSANNLTLRSYIHSGERLVILPVDGIQYTVRRGDTLQGIALRFNADVSKIMSANARTNPDDLAVGELLILPGGVLPRPTIQQRAPQQSTLIGRIRNVFVPVPVRSIARGTSFIWPTSARRITQYFSWRHTGVDIAGPSSNRIFAAANGTVVFAGWARGYGNSIVVDHGNGLQTRYGHSSKLLVTRGEYVSRGETIAMVGSTGRSTGPHLHFEVIVKGRRVNPFEYIR